MMIKLMGKRVTVFGLARSGVGAANLLVEMGAEVTVTDNKSENALSEMTRKLAPSVKLSLGGHRDDAWMSAEMLVVSPGVPTDIGPITAAKEKGMTVIGELELAYRIMEDRIPFLAVTGSNGKSTTTTLLNHMLTKSGLRTVLGGNIGTALTEEILKIVNGKKVTVKNKNSIPEPYFSPLTFHFLPDVIVVEVSSFQLETVDTFRPHVASILNITPDHMDRYHTINDYAAAKARIFENQEERDFLVLNADDPETVNTSQEKIRAKTRKPEIFYFSRSGEVRGVYYKNGTVYCNIPFVPLSPLPFPLIKASDIKIKGVHNLENAMAAAAMALLANCPAGAVIESLREFPGLEHRLEFVRELNGVKYVNDSKGTNIGAVIKSLESFQEPLILIAGGRDKAGDFSLLRKPVSEKVKALVLIGEAAEKMREALEEVTDTIIVKDLTEAVEISRKKAKRGDAVLLSPACASFDMFRDFEDRGRQFKKIVMGMNT
jgi:UDP-N-acetylmuramoylalanine--D-glutamate ligase